jgi:hypothetical protein
VRLKELASSSDDHGEREAIVGAASTIAVVADRIENKHVHVNAEFLLRAEELLTGRGQQLPLRGREKRARLAAPFSKIQSRVYTDRPDNKCDSMLASTGRLARSGTREKVLRRSSSHGPVNRESTDLVLLCSNLAESR